MISFKQMQLPKELLQTLDAINFTQPTKIQQQAIPLALQGHNILGSAQTGTGKTAAFTIPLIVHLLNNPGSKALVVTPTRELAMQVTTEIRKMLGRNSKLKALHLIGGESILKQLSKLKQNPDILVGTPGRINDHLIRKSLKLSDANFLVLDETDRMLDMGFKVQIETILQRMPQQKQTLLFSATMPKNIEHIAKEYMSDFERIAVESKLQRPDNLVKVTKHISEGEKYAFLEEELHEREGAIIVFVRTKFQADKMSLKLVKAGFASKAFHGDLRQHQRTRVIDAFRKEKFNILVATDVAARGIDIPHINHVINYDIPQMPEDYVHRIGRTARANAKGFALNIVSPVDKNRWHAIDVYLDPSKKAAKPSFNKNSKKPSNRRRPSSSKAKYAKTSKVNQNFKRKSKPAR